MVLDWLDVILGVVGRVSSFQHTTASNRFRRTPERVRAAGRVLARLRSDFTTPFVSSHIRIARRACSDG